MHRLRMDQSALKRVQSDQAKAAMKRQLLPHYEGWIEGTLDGDSGRQDEVIVTLMVWAIDAGDYALAARIGRYVVTHGLLMPDRFNRTAATVLVDEICDPILVQVKADDTTDVTPYLAVLDEVAEFTADSDMPDVVRAKLCKARAFALRNGTTEEQATALELLRQALTLDAGAGVKKEIDRLARVVKKPPHRQAPTGLIAPMVPMALAMLAETPRRTARVQAKLQHRQIRRQRPAPQRPNHPQKHNP
jgi:hypothetical protein